MNFAQLVKFAKSKGYTGPCEKSDIEAIKSFLSAKAGGEDKVVKSGNLSIKIANIALDNQGNLIDGGSSATMDIMLDGGDSTGEPMDDDAKGLNDKLKTKGIDADDVVAKVTANVAKSIDKLIEPHLAKFTGDVSVGKSIRERMYDNRVKKGTAKFSDYRIASGFGDYLLHLSFKAQGNYEGSQKHLREAQKALTMTPGSADVLGTTQIIPDVLKQVDDYGKAAQRFNVINLSEYAGRFYRSINSILTVTYPPEGNATNDVNANYQGLEVLPRKGMVITKMSKESRDDAKINLAEQVVDDIARSFAYAEDRAAINGDGTGTFGGMVGLQTMFGSSGAPAGLTLSTAAGAINTTYAGTSAGDWGGYALGHFQRVAATLPNWVYEKFTGDVAWHCTRAFYEGVMKPLAISASRATATEVLTLQGSTFLSWPVVFWENMNRTASTGTSTIDCFFGSMKSACYLGRRNDLQIDVSDQRYWDEDNIGVKGTMRHDVNVYAAVGTTSTPGPIIALYQV